MGDEIETGEQLFGILVQAIPAIAEGGIVIVRADTRIQPYALDNRLRIKSFHLRVGVQLIEEAHAERQIRVGKQLHRLRLRATHKQHRNVLLDGPLLDERRKNGRRLR